MKPIPPVMREILVAVTPAEAFDAFTASIGKWWPSATHSMSSGVCKAPSKDVIMEPRAGGRLYEIMANGEESLWGTVTDWAPGERVGFTWHVGRPPEEHTNVEVSFRASEAGTKVILTHSNWERLGEAAADTRKGYDSGWVGVFDGAYGDFVASLQSRASAS